MKLSSWWRALESLHTAPWLHRDVLTPLLTTMIVGGTGFVVAHDLWRIALVGLVPIAALSLVLLLRWYFGFFHARILRGGHGWRNQAISLHVHELARLEIVEADEQ